ncbi:MAG: hypothetical protein KDB03_10170 [Planctomycetales bacterium]|nr:hypothetical protein [Planctomycetales bacterium]
MQNIRKQATVARRRMTVERFLRFLPKTMVWGAILAAVGVGLPKLVYMDISYSVWFLAWTVGAVVLALITNVCLTLLGKPSLSDAAAEVDRRFGLRERLSSSLLLGKHDRETNLGQALISDAERRASTIDVRDKFGWGFQRSLWYPVLPALLCCVLWYVPNREKAIDPTQETKIDITQVKNSTKALLEEVKKKREQAELHGLNEAADMFKSLESKLADLQKNTKLDSKQSLAELSDIKEQLEERRQELGSADSLQKSLKNLEKFESGPADDLADALKKGDFEDAEEAVQKLLEKLESGKLDADDMQKLAKQLSQLEKNLSDAASANEQAKQALKDQIEQAQAAGDMQKAAQLQRKLEIAESMAGQMAQMQQMANSLSQAQQSMQQGNMQATQEALDQLASQLQQMNGANSQLQDLDQLLDRLAQSKSQMACSQCNGMGCSSCMGSMLSQFPGKGMGEGKGQGERPEEEGDVDFFDSQVRDMMKLGETINAGSIGGENRKGITRSEVQSAVVAAMADEPEPLDETPLPKGPREHARDYFNSVREGR